MNTELDRAERDVEEHSIALTKPLGLRDLVLTQILFVVGSSWVGTAAKLGPSHLFFWLLAILLFYIPQAAVVIYLNRLMPLEGGLYQWAKLGFNEFAGFIVAWNLWLLSITVIALGGMFVTTNISYAIGETAAWMPNSKWCVSLISCALVIGLGWTAVRGLALGEWVHNVGGLVMLLVYGTLIALPFIGLARAHGCGLGPARASLVHAHASKIQNANQLGGFCQHHHSGDCYFQPDWRWNSRSVSTRRQRSQCFLRRRLLALVRHSNFRDCFCSFRCTGMAAGRIGLWLCCFIACHFLHRLSHHRRAEPASLRHENRRRSRYRERRRCRHLRRCAPKASRLTTPATFADPTKIIGRALGDVQSYDFRNIVRM